MPLNNFEFPAVTYDAAFEASATAASSDLGVCCIGTAFKMHNLDNNSAVQISSLDGSGSLAAYNATSGISGIDLLNSSQAKLTSMKRVDSDLKHQRLVIKNGIWSYLSVTSGFVFETKTSSSDYTGWIRFSQTISPVYKDLIAYERGVKAGDVIRITYRTAGGSEGVVFADVEKIAPLTDSEFQSHRLKIASGDIPVSADGTSVTVSSIDFCVKEDAVFTGLDSVFTLNDAGVLSVSGGISINLQAFLQEDTPLPTGDLQAGDLYFEFRERNAAYVAKRGVVTSIADVQEILGTPSNSNPLALACTFAVSASNGVPVYFTSVADESPASYVAALKAMERYADTYSIVPCTTDADIIQAVCAYCESISGNDESRIRRVCWYAIDLESKPSIFTGTAVYYASKAAADATGIILKDASAFIYSENDSVEGLSAWKTSGEGNDILYTESRNPQTNTKFFELMSTGAPSVASNNAVEATGSDEAVDATTFTTDGSVVYNYSASLSGSSLTAWTTTDGSDTVVVYTLDRNPDAESDFYVVSDGAELSTLAGYTAERSAYFIFEDGEPFRGLTGVEDIGIRLNNTDKEVLFKITGTNEINVCYVTLEANSVLPASVVNGTACNVSVIRSNPVGADFTESLVKMKQQRASSERAQCVWADGILYKGEIVSNIAGAAAAAGMRSSEPPHRPLSNIGYSFFNVADTNNFTVEDLKYIGSNGIWIIDENTDGIPVNKKQVTTAVANQINLDEESIIANVDVIGLSLMGVGQSIVGSSNINRSLIILLESQLTTILDSFVNGSYPIYTGPQLVAYNINSIAQDPVNLDHIYASIDLYPPYPFNKFTIKVQVR